MASIKFNNDVKFIISDVDETIANLYVEAEIEMIKELNKLLTEGKVIFMISGQSVKSICWRITDHIKSELRRGIIIGHCSGSEVWGFDESGDLRKKPYYSVYDSSMNESQKETLREIIKQLIAEFNLEVFDTMPILNFRKKTNENPLAIMLEDRGPQITFEVVNGYDLPPDKANQLELKMPETHGSYDLRIPILERAVELLNRENIPVTPRLAGVFAIDFAIKGVSKTTAVKNILTNEKVLSQLGLNKAILSEPQHIEVWGDKFSTVKGGTDRHISAALPKQVRSITFREETPDEFLEGYNIVVWDGKAYLHHGLLEFLKSR
jgi:hydroxymethylpyrimidine pyrophosphatase-like HAD family hydrolase